MNKTKKSYEKNMARVTEIAEKLDIGGLPLANSIDLYKEAVEIIGHMRGELETAKASVAIMRRSADGAFFEDEVREDEF